MLIVSAQQMEEPHVGGFRPNSLFKVKLWGLTAGNLNGISSNNNQLS